MGLLLTRLMWFLDKIWIVSSTDCKGGGGILAVLGRSLYTCRLVQTNA